MTYQKITIPLDHGNRNMKTAEEVFTSGLVESDLKPVLGEYLQYNGKYYSLTDTGRKKLSVQISEWSDFYKSVNKILGID